MSRRFLVQFAAFAIVSGLFGILIVSVFIAQSYNIYRNTRYDYEGTGFLSSNPEIGYAGARNGFMRHLPPPQFEFYSDDRGTRVDRAGVLAPNETDVLVIGDSFSWGDGVDDQETYPKILGQMTGLQVTNAAEPSYATVASLLSIELYADMRPKFIIYGFTDGQMMFNFSRCANGGIFVCRPMAYLDTDISGQLAIKPPIDDGSVYVDFIRDMYFPHSFGWRDVYWSVYRDFYLVGMNTRRPKRPQPAWWPPQGDAEEYFRFALDPQWRARGFKLLMAMMADRVERMGAKLILLHIPSDNQFNPIAPEALSAVTDLIENRKIIFVESNRELADAAKLSSVDNIISPLNNHPTPEGHRALAEVVRAWIGPK